MADLDPRVAASLSRLRATFDGLPAEEQAKRAARAEELDLITSSPRTRRRPLGTDAARAFLDALATFDADAEAKDLNEFDRRDGIAPIVAQFLAQAYSKPFTEAGRDTVWICFRDHGEAIVRKVAVELLRERASNVREPFGVFRHRCQKYREDLDASKARRYQAEYERRSASPPTQSALPLGQGHERPAQGSVGV